MLEIKTSFLNNEKLPFVIEPREGKGSKKDLFAYLSAHQDFLRKNLLKYGGLLFRNFELTNADDFASFIEQLQLGKSINYIGGDSPRNKIKGGVYTSTEAPPSIKIPLHNELSFVKNYPRHIYFFCETPSKVGGATIIADARKIFHGIQKDVKKRFIDKKLRYESCYYYKSKLMNWVNKLQPSHKSWIHVFETDSKKEVEEKCKEHEFEYEWKKNDWIKISQTRPATMKHPETGEDVWFNQAHLYDFNPKLLGLWRYLAAKLFYIRPHTRLHQVFYANKQRIERQDFYHILKTLDDHTLSFPWKAGDVLVLDNVLTMHGRETFEGKRRILTAMTS